MTPLKRVVITAVAFVGATAVAAANTPSNVLNKLEVQKLVAMERPVADLALAVHFNALADRYLVEAARHRATAAVFRANAHRSTPTTAANQYDLLAQRATEWAARARELATYHVLLATGKPAIVPEGASALHGGYGAPEPTADQLHRLARLARTRSDHLVLVEYYAEVVKNKTVEADRHLRFATGYRAGVHKGVYDAAAVHDRLAAVARRAAKQAREAAERHRVFANIA